MFLSRMVCSGAPEIQRQGLYNGENILVIIYSFAGRSRDTAEVSRGPSSQDGGLPVPVRVLSQTTGHKAAHEESCQVR
jgi:hypothetical protein